jgi:uncharacterized protein DUF6265
MRLLFFLLIIFTSFLSAQEKDLTKVSLAELEWMLGEWQKRSSGTITNETWNKLDNTYFEGYNERISRRTKKILFTETLKLVKIGNEIYYIALVEENDTPISFKLTQIDSAKAVFENPDHDFPQTIQYELLESGSLRATVGGVENKKKRSFEIVFKKVN